MKETYYRKTDGREGNCTDCATSWWSRTYSQWQCPRRGLDPVDALHVCDAFSDRQKAEETRREIFVYGRPETFKG